jgi:16S rRNA G1207 methylase RsmC
VPIGEEKESTDDEKPEGNWKQLRTGEKSDGVAQESDQWESTDATEGVCAFRGFMFFAFESNQKREEEDENDLDGVGWEKTIEFHSRPGSFERESIERGAREVALSGG